MTHTTQMLATAFVLLVCSLVPAISNGDIVLTSGEVNINGSALVGRNGSVDSLGFNDQVTGTPAVLSTSDSVSVGPLPFLSSILPGTTATGTSAASTLIDFTNPDEIVIEMEATAILSSIESDGNGSGSYGVTAGSDLEFGFMVDEATDYQFDALVQLPESPAWQIRLLGPSGFLYNNLTDAGGGTLTRTAVLQPGSYFFSAFISNGLGGPIPATTRTSTMDMNFQVARAVPEPSVSILTFLAAGVLLLRKRI